MLLYQHVVLEIDGIGDVVNDVVMDLDVIDKSKKMEKSDLKIRI